MARDFFAQDDGLTQPARLRLWRSRRFGCVTDRLFDAKLRSGPHYRALAASLPTPPRDILVVGAQVDTRREMMAQVISALVSQTHRITYEVIDAGDRGKLENINLLLARHDLGAFDWVIMTDDDIAIEPGFVDLFVAACEHAGLRIAMPAHRYGSYLGYALTLRKWGSLARRTNFVEVGPLVAFHRDTFASVFPLPELRYGWGLDMHWPALARDRGWPIGIVDAAPLRHLRPVGKGYPREAAVDEAVSFLSDRAFLPRSETFKTMQRWPS